MRSYWIIAFSALVGFAATAGSSQAQRYPLDPNTMHHQRGPGGYGAYQGYPIVPSYGAPQHAAQMRPAPVQNQGYPSGVAQQYPSTFQYPSTLLPTVENPHHSAGYGRPAYPRQDAQPNFASPRNVINPIPEQDIASPSDRVHQGAPLDPRHNEAIGQYGQAHDPHAYQPHGASQYGGHAYGYHEGHYGHGSHHAGGHQSWCNGGCGGACSSGGHPSYFGHGYVDSMTGGWAPPCVACGGTPCSCARRGGWFGGASGMIMARDYESNVYLSYYGSDPRNNILTSRSAELGSMGGYEFSVGRCMKNGWAWMATYWGLVQDEESISSTGFPDTRLFGMNWVDYQPQGYANDNVYNWYNNSFSHRVRRENEFHNLEINFLNGSMNGSCLTNISPCADDFGACGTFASDCGPSWNVQWMVGARYFKFDEYFQYASSVAGGYVYAPRELFYDIETENNLVGFQAGGLIQRAIGQCWTVFADTKFGFYNNRIQHRSAIVGPSGYAVINNGTYSGTDFNFRSSKDDLSFLGELNVGVRYRFSNCWRATAGYRAMAATGIALAPDQIPYDFSHVPGIRYVDSDGSLIMHGVYAGLEFRR